MADLLIMSVSRGTLWRVLRNDFRSGAKLLTFYNAFDLRRNIPPLSFFFVP